MPTWSDYKLTNLLQETIQALANESKTPEDVDWVGSKNGQHILSWDQFAAFATNFNYDDGYGSHEIPLELVVVGKADWWLERHEYDGSEWWEYKQKPTRALTQTIIDAESDVPRDALVIAREYRMNEFMARLLPSGEDNE